MKGVSSFRRSVVRNPVWWNLLLVLAVSAWYESLWLHYRVNLMDEMWPLYAAMKMRAGGTLYQDVLWVFPPGHLLAAWLASWLDPPGVVLARTFYAVFQTALVAACYFLGRRLMPAPFALLAALLIAVAAPRSHAFQVVFGYRYLVFAVLSLLAFGRRLDTGDPRWMYAAGACAGIGLVFRLTPAYAVACGVGVGALAAQRDWRAGLADCARFAVALVAVVAPFLAYFASSVGLPRLWHELVVHPFTMLQLQSTPMPDVITRVPDHRRSLVRWFVAVEFRAQFALYCGFLVWLVVGAARARWKGVSFARPFELAVVVFGAVYFTRSLVRADEPHLDSAIPTGILLATWLVAIVFRAVWPDTRAPRFWRPAAQVALGAALIASWLYALGTDLYFNPKARGTYQLVSTTEDIRLRSKNKSNELDLAVQLLRNHTAPDDVVLMMGATPLFHVFTGRLGPGYFDTIMPGTFMTEDDEVWFIEHLESDPPAAVVWSSEDFDSMTERSLVATAPRLSQWVRRRYRPAVPEAAGARWIVMVPKADSRR